MYTRSHINVSNSVKVKISFTFACWLTFGRASALKWRVDRMTCLRQTAIGLQRYRYPGNFLTGALLWGHSPFMGPRHIQASLSSVVTVRPCITHKLRNENWYQISTTSIPVFISKRQRSRSRGHLMTKVRARNVLLLLQNRKPFQPQTCYVWYSEHHVEELTTHPPVTGQCTYCHNVFLPQYFSATALRKFSLVQLGFYREYIIYHCCCMSSNFSLCVCATINTLYSVHFAVCF